MTASIIGPHPDETSLLGVECRCGQRLISTTKDGLAAQLAVHWRREDWAVDSATAADIGVAGRWVTAHGFALDEAELQD